MKAEVPGMEAAFDGGSCPAPGPPVPPAAPSAVVPSPALFRLGGIVCKCGCGCGGSAGGRGGKGEERTGERVFRRALFASNPNQRPRVDRHLLLLPLHSTHPHQLHTQTIAFTMSQYPASLHTKKVFRELRKRRQQSSSSSSSASDGALALCVMGSPIRYRDDTDRELPFR